MKKKTIQAEEAEFALRLGTRQEAEFLGFVEANREMGYGRMLQMISAIWYRSDPDGALTVGPCYGTMVRHRERCKKEGHDVSHGTNWDWCDRCGARLDPDTGKEAR